MTIVLSDLRCKFEIRKSNKKLQYIFQAMYRIFH